MAEFKLLIQQDDWKKEKHVPFIEIQDTIKKGEVITVTVSVGKEIPHPNKTEHHIRWISVYFMPLNEKFPYELAKAEFTSHGESINGPDSSTIYTQPKITFQFKTEKSGTLFALSYCNIHGLWQNSLDIKVL